MGIRLVPVLFLALALLAACQPTGSGGSAPRAATGVPPAATAPAAANPTAGAAQASAPTADTSFPRMTVQVGTVGSFTDAGFAIGIGQGYFARQNLDIQTQRLDSAAKMIPFVSTGQLDVAGGGPGAGLFQAFSRGVDLKIVADKGTAGDTQSYFCYLVRKDLIDSGRVKTEADLRGLTFANSAPGISVDLPTARMLQKGGLTEQDLTIVYMSYPDMVSALGTQRVDVAATLEPACAQAVSDGIAVRWRTTSDYVPRQSVAMVMYSAPFAQNREAAVRFMVGYLQGVRDYRKAYLEKDAALRQKLDPILAEWTGIDARVYDQMVLPELHADGTLNVESIEALQDYEVESGQVQERVDLRKFIDDSIREEALRRLDGR